MMDAVMIDRDPEREAEYRDNLHVLGSFPRSGSHWTRRMIGEIIALRYGMDAAFGRNLGEVSGFELAPLNSDTYISRPHFVAAHDLDRYPVECYDIYLRRDFESVWKSTQKAQKELPVCWWGGTREECYKKWDAHVARGCTMAKLVIDYNMTQLDPTGTVRAIFNLIKLSVTEEEITRAVLVGNRKNMLKEQEMISSRRWDVINRVDKTNVPPLRGDANREICNETSVI